MEYVITEQELQELANMVEVLPWRNAQPIMDLLKKIVMTAKQKQIAMAEKLKHATKEQE